MNNKLIFAIVSVIILSGIVFSMPVTYRVINDERKECAFSLSFDNPPSGWKPLFSGDIGKMNAEVCEALKKLDPLVAFPNLTANDYKTLNNYIKEINCSDILGRYDLADTYNNYYCTSMKYTISDRLVEEPMIEVGFLLYGLLLLSPLFALAFIIYKCAKNGFSRNKYWIIGSIIGFLYWLSYYILSTTYISYFIYGLPLPYVILIPLLFDRYLTGLLVALPYSMILFGVIGYLIGLKLRKSR
jgi:hypothetical protein